MKNFIFLTVITLSILLTGCEADIEKKARIEFEKSAEIDFSKARKSVEQKIDKATVQKWIDNNSRLKELEKEYQVFESKKNKHNDWSKHDWSLNKESNNESN